MSTINIIGTVEHIEHFINNFDCFKSTFFFALFHLIFVQFTRQYFIGLCFVFDLLQLIFLRLNFNGQFN